MLMIYSRNGKKLNNVSKRAEIVGNLVSAFETEDGRNYLHPEFLVDEYLKLTEEQKQRNEAYWQKTETTNSSEEPQEGSEEEEGGDEETEDTEEDSGDFEI